MVPPSFVLPPLSVVRLVNAFEVPTAPANVVVPLSTTDNACVPSTVEAKVMSLPLNTRSPPNTNAVL